MSIPLSPLHPEPRQISIRARGPAIAIIMTSGLAAGAATACIWRPDGFAPLTLIPAWCWLLAGLLSTIPAWLSRRRRLSCVLMALWLLFAVGWVEELRSLARGVVNSVSSGAHAAERPLRIVSLNCANEERSLLDLQRMQPDVVLLQEAPGSESLAKMTARLFDGTGNFLAGGDTAILARGQIQPLFVDRSTHFVAGTVTFADGRTLNGVSLRLAPPVSRLDFWSTRFWTDHRDKRIEHRRELRETMDRIRSLPSATALVVGGDFNTTPLDRSLDELRPHLSDAFHRSGLGWGATGTNDWPLFRVDQIWANSRLTPLRVTAEKTHASDHRMVVCDAVYPE